MTMAQSSVKTYKHIKYVGVRPKNDQDNLCRAKLCNLVQDTGCFYEICAEKLYLVNLAKDEDSKLFCEQQMSDPACPFIFWGLHDTPTLSYEAFNMDFGPFNLATTHQFCSKLKVWLDTQSLRDPDKYIVIVSDDQDTKKKLNLILLVSIAAMVLLNLTDEEVIQRLGFFMMHKPKVGETHKELIFYEKKKFNDVSGNQSILTLTLEDCIRAFYAAIQAKFYEYYKFDHTEYLFYETVMSGDLNWIIPDKILAFAGPSDKAGQSIFTQKHSPEFYYSYFRDHNVTTIIRLNDPEYDSSSFQDAGFDHYDLIFPDGYPPTSTIASKFINIVDEARGAVAVHCYAGIGRTGTLIAAYLIARYNFSPQMAIAWTRICRPGSVIGEQQDWLFNNFQRLSFVRTESKSSRLAKLKKTKPETTKEPTLDSAKLEQNSNTSYAVDEKNFGQAKALLLAKKQRERHDRPCTRNSSLLRNLDTEEATKKQEAKEPGIILDLGRTIPLQLKLNDFIKLKAGEAPEYYHLKDNRYEWRVKFPQPGYVALRYDQKRDVKALNMNCIDIDKITLYREAKLDFKYEQETVDKVQATATKDKNSAKLKPVVYYCADWLCENFSMTQDD